MKNLKEMFDKINNEHFGGVITPIPVVWNNRLRVCAGKCFYSRLSLKPTKIEISKPIFQKVQNADKVWITLAHEMTHAYLLEHKKETGHTQNFQNIMTRITGENKNHRCHEYDVTGLRNNKNYYYSCECGIATGYRTRAPKKGAIYRSNCCNSIVTFKKIESAASQNKKSQSSTFKKLF